jgi:hypothetical protein
MIALVCRLLPPNPEAVELSQHPWFDGKITPQQADRLIRATMQMSPEHPVLCFNDLGDFWIVPEPIYLQTPTNREEGDRLRANSPMKLHPERWQNSCSLNRLAMEAYTKYRLYNVEHDRKLAAQLIVARIKNPYERWEHWTPSNP